MKEKIILILVISSIFFGCCDVSSSNVCGTLIVTHPSGKKDTCHVCSTHMFFIATNYGREYCLYEAGTENIISVDVINYSFIKDK